MGKKIMSYQEAVKDAAHPMSVRSTAWTKFIIGSHVKVFLPSVDPTDVFQGDRMWVKVESVDEASKTLSGTIDNRPVSKTSVSLGDQLTDIPWSVVEGVLPGRR